MLSTIAAASTAQDKTAGQWTDNTAAKWFRNGEWKNGLKLNVNQPIDKITFAVQYHKNKAGWDKAFAFLRDSDLVALKPGRYDIDGDNVYALITEAPSKTFEQSGWESHRKYIDLQYVIVGKEKIGVVNLSQATVTKPYDEAKDYANYSADGKFYTATPDAFFLFFPNDVHRPNILIKGYEVVKKVVIKIRLVD